MTHDDNVANFKALSQAVKDNPCLDTEMALVKVWNKAVTDFDFPLIRALSGPGETIGLHVIEIVVQWRQKDPDVQDVIWRRVKEKESKS